MPRDVYTLPPDLPVPVDDGAADHLRGAAVPALALAATSGRVVDLAGLARQPAVLFFYPRTGKLPVPNFSAGGIATPADAALMMQLGAEAVFVGSGIFKSADPAKRAKAIVQATTHFKDPDVLVKVSEDLGDAMVGLEISKMAEKDLLQTRGW